MYSEAFFVFLQRTTFLNWDPRIKKKVGVQYITFTDALEIFI